MKKMIFIVLSLCIATGSVSAKSILEKTVFFFNPDLNKIDSAKYWTVFLGSYPSSLERKFPGLDPKRYNCDLNFNLLSSGYVEGYGMTSKGRVDCEPAMMGEGGSASQKITLDSVEYIFDNARSIKLKNGPTLSFYLDVEGEKVMLRKKLTLKKFRLQVIDEDRNLKAAGDVNITWFAFSKAAAIAAQKADKAAEAAAQSQEGGN
jgi:hypothetical protein